MDTVTVDQDLSSGAATTEAEEPAIAAAPQVTEEASPAEETVEEKPKRGRPKQSAARKTRTVELVLTVTGTAEGEWQAELVHAGKRVVTGLEVAAAAVSRAAKELHPDISGRIEEVISAAREQHQKRAAELQAELEKVQAALAELED